MSVLASGSGGNALVAEANGTMVLIDCGISMRQLERRMRALHLDPHSLTALFLTHEHGDHVRGAEVLLRHYEIPVFATSGTAEALGAGVVLAEVLCSGRTVRVGALELLPVATSHDAREPVGFILEAGGCRVGVVTDTGVTTQLVLERYRGCHGLLLESNHDPDLLRYGPYPWPLKQRIASASGHLSNEQARDALETLAHDQLEVVVGMHLSRENNRPDLVARELTRPLSGSKVRIQVADQHEALVVDVAGPKAHAAPAAGQAVRSAG